MRFVLYTNSVSAHQLPLAREIVKHVGADNFRYIYTGTTLQGGNQEIPASEPWIIKEKEPVHSSTSTQNFNADQWLEACDVLLCGGLRPFDLFERRAAKGLRTFYQSERWFKPIDIGVGHRGMCGVPGWIRLLHPGYAKMVRRFRRLVANVNFHVLPIGPHARRDFWRLGVQDSKMMDWGYFVAPSDKKGDSIPQLQHPATSKPLRVLWVGRPLWWKRVDTIRKAVAHVPNAILDLFTNIPITQVREEMRKHDIYVLASNEMEGWGAALSEAMEEGMICFGTYEAGASAALLPESHLFPCGDWRALAGLLASAHDNYEATPVPPDYTAAGAAKRLLEVCL